MKAAGAATLGSKAGRGMKRELAEPLLEDSYEGSYEADVLRFAHCWRMWARALVGCAYGALLWAVVYPWAEGAAGARGAMLLTVAAVLVPCIAAVHRGLWLVSVRRSLPSPPSDLEAAPAAAADYVERELVIGAPISVVFDAMVDFESLPEWASGINEVVDETPPGSSTRLVKFNSGVMGINVTYTLAYTLVRPTRVSWISVAGAVKRIVGEYRLTPVDAASTRVNYRLEVDAGFSIPGPVRRAVNGLVVGAALPALKRHVESSARACSSSSLATERKAALAELRRGSAEQPAPAGWVKCSDGGFVRILAADVDPATLV